MSTKFEFLIPEGSPEDEELNSNNSKTWESSKPWEIKVEQSSRTTLTIIVLASTFHPIIFHQPSNVFHKSTNEKQVFTIPHFVTDSGPLVSNKKLLITIKPIMRTRLIRRKKNKQSLVYRLEKLLKPKISDDEESMFNSDEEYWAQPKRGMEHLPEDTLRKIFFEFSVKDRCWTLSRVCRSWNAILKDPIFWTDIEFNGKEASCETIGRVLKNSPALTRLVLVSVPKAAEVLRVLCRYNHKITDLAIRHCEMDDRESIGALHLVIACCSLLRFLDLKGTKFQSPRFFEELGHLRKLASLNLGANQYIYPQDLMTLSLNCYHLKELQLLNRPMVKDRTKKLKDESASFMIGNFNQLTTLKLDMHGLGNATFSVILNCSHLECLILTNCLLITGYEFQKLKKLENLRKLTITRGNELGPQDFQDLFNGKFEKLHELKVDGCWRIGNEGVSAITNLPKLKSLSVKNCRTVTSECLPFFKKCRKLEKLNLAYTDVDLQNMIWTELGNLKLLIIDKTMSIGTSIDEMEDTLPRLKIIVINSDNKRDKFSLSDSDE